MSVFAPLFFTVYPTQFPHMLAIMAFVETMRIMSHLLQFVNWTTERRRGWMASWCTAGCIDADTSCKNPNKLGLMVRCFYQCYVGFSDEIIFWRVHRENRGTHTSHISKKMGQDWKRLSPEEKEPYRQVLVLFTLEIIWLLECRVWLVFNFT